MKPCRFCGFDGAIGLIEPFDAGYIAHVHCPKCGANGPSVYDVSSRNAAVEARQAWDAPLPDAYRRL